MRALVVVPARDEEARIARCLEALAAQEGAEPPGVVLVLDGCEDATAEVALATAAVAGLAVELVDGPGRGVGHARRLGLEAAATRLRPPAAPAGGPALAPPAEVTDAGAVASAPVPVLLSTDADSVVATDWLARTLAHVDAGAQAVGGRIVLDLVEAARLPLEVLAAREAEAERRLAAVRRHAPGAEHHQFSGASLALTLAAHDAVGGVPAVTALEDEALERALRAAGIAITYAADVRVTTSARIDGRVPRGLAQVLRAAVWQAGDPVPAGRPPAPPATVVEGARTRDAPGAQAPAVTAITSAPTRRDAPGSWEPDVALVDDAGARGDALDAARTRPGALVLALGPGVDADAAEPLLAALRADPALVLVRAAEPEPDPLAELVVRPALNLHAPELAVLASPLTRTWAARRELLERLALPHGAAADLTVLVDAWRHHGLGAIAERPVPAPTPAVPADPPLAAYELLAALAARFAEPPALSSAFAAPAGTRRAALDEHPARRT